MSKNAPATSVIAPRIPLRLAPVRSAPASLTPWKLANSNTEFERSTPEKLIPDRSDDRKFAPRNAPNLKSSFALADRLLKSTPWNIAWSNFAWTFPLRFENSPSNFEEPEKSTLVKSKDGTFQETPVKSNPERIEPRKLPAIVEIPERSIPLKSANEKSRFVKKLPRFAPRSFAPEKFAPEIDTPVKSILERSQPEKSKLIKSVSFAFDCGLSHLIPDPNAESSTFETSPE